MCKSAAIANLRHRIASIAIGAAICAESFSAHAQTLRLRGDAIVDTQGGPEAPVGLVVLQGQGQARSWFDAEGLVWAGAKPNATADVLVLAAHLRAPHNHAEARVGRFVLATGAIMPVQIDGADVVARAPWGSSVEAFGGAPVVPRFGARSYDWLAGGRVAQSIVSKATVGISYMQRREDGDVSNEEIGADLFAVPLPWLDVAAKCAYDLTSPGIADARVSAAAKVSAYRFEIFATEQSPGRLLPATSLFSVLGDFPSEMVGGTAKWRAAPRLDLLASGAGQLVGGEMGANGFVRSTLRLDDRGDGNLGVEVRRVDVSTARWTGFRAVGAEPLGRGFRLSSEIEIVVPDAPDGRGVAWPWGLLSLAWRSRNGWEFAGAVEGASSPEHRYELNALARMSRSLELH